MIYFDDTVDLQMYAYLMVVFDIEMNVDIHPEYENYLIHSKIIIKFYSYTFILSG
jgi:hypothetical protein